jgi:excisionase family DNA binding protein
MVTRIRTTNPPNVVRLLTRAEAAERLGLSTKSVDRLLQRGELRAIRLGAAVRIDPRDLDDLIRNARDRG